jgi:uncharacterized UPF0160 family protein
MTVKEIKKIKKAVTHAGSFHPDDVFSTAFLQMINPKIKVSRVTEVPEGFGGLAFDIGLGEFDHHQADNEVRENGIPYASFGKLWKAFAPELYGDEITKRVDKKFIQDLDAYDCQGIPNALANAIYLYNPLFSSKSNGEKEFWQAVKVAKKLFTLFIKTEMSILKQNEKVLEIYKESDNKKIIVMDKRYHFKDILPSTEAIYVVYPSKRGGYTAQGVTKNDETIELKKPFPSTWKENKPDYITFCHNSLFLITANTKEEVIKACEEALRS